MIGVERKKISLIVEPFCSVVEHEQVRPHLLQLGFTVESLFSTVDQSLRTGSDKQILVLIFGRQSQHKKDIVESLLKKYPAAPKLGIFLPGSMQSDYEMVECCCEFVTWPCQSEEMLLRLERLHERAKDLSLSSPAGMATKSFPMANLIGRSSAFREVLDLVSTYSSCAAPVLIEGDTGTGKEMIARAIHYSSERSEHPFIPVNCGALPDNLIENELFGHVKGAYTDAKSAQQGLIGQADRGTLFLDEVETLSPKAQVALLRFLQEMEYKPLGSSRPLKVDVRIIAASNISLKALVDSGAVRQDLYFRLNILSVQMPRLQDRQRDVLFLAEYFLSQYCSQYELAMKEFHSQVVNWMLSYDWPGNVRELENLVHRAVLVSNTDTVRMEHLNHAAWLAETSDDASTDFDGDEVSIDLAFNEAKSKMVAEFEKQYLCRLMRRTNGNVTQAAKHACKERRALGKLLKKYGIDRNLYL